MAPAPRPEFSRPVDVPRMLGKTALYPIAADEDEREALAARFALLSLDRLEAEVRLERLRGGLVRLAATLAADVVQECVITLEPFATHVEDEFTLLYSAMPDTREIVIESEAETVEPFDGASIDIGEAVAQQLSLALDPFPHAPGATLPESE